MKTKASITKISDAKVLDQNELPSIVPACVEQAGAICFRVRNGQMEILLIGSRRNGRWGIPKGGIEIGESSRQAARREAFEEAGARGKTEAKAIGVFNYTKEGRPLSYRVTVHLLQVKAIAKKFAEQGQRASTWATIPEALKMTWNEELQAILKSLS